MVKIKYLKNERGYALVLALFAIVIISLLGLTLLGSTISTAKQTNQTDTYYRTTHLAEMGVKFTEAHIYQYVQTNERPLPGSSESTVKDYIEDMFRHIRAQADLVVVDSQYPNREYQILENLEINVSAADAETEVVFSVKGIDDEKEKELDATFVLDGLGGQSDSSDSDDINWEDLFPTSPTEEWIVQEGEAFPNPPGDDNKYNGNTWVNGNSTVKLTDVTINGDCVMNGNFYSGNGHPDITICGSAKFNKEVTDTQGQPGFKANLMIGNHAIYEDKLFWHNGNSRDYLSGGSTYFKKGAEIGNGPFVVGQDLIIDASTGVYNFSSDVSIKRDLIILNYDPTVNTDVLTIKNSDFYVGGSIKIFDKSGKPVTDQSRIPPTTQTSDSNNGKDKNNIVYHYSFSDTSIFEPTCKITNGTDDLFVDVVHVEY
ncbi:hypothetical protein HNQ94_003546 [Salirhabdus euzebyi]|uniref:Type 4 fimbrial biogenesis protein PilX N-terminal domain-containing protein n=1 Tax=Salirhabdus euzebyi TaxID=394506 RepID=A0A841Q984_9BACI|nr:hypothetical protein [Salirhabdus euzebyi]MBB6455051.1 hypothetical protein [Salirhabdus euzebyi]